jgi:hypothetical protein
MGVKKRIKHVRRRAFEGEGGKCRISGGISCWGRYKNFGKSRKIGFFGREKNLELDWSWNIFR